MTYKKREEELRRDLPLFGWVCAFEEINPACLTDRMAFDLTDYSERKHVESQIHRVSKLADEFEYYAHLCDTAVRRMRKMCEEEDKHIKKHFDAAWTRVEDARTGDI